MALAGWNRSRTAALAVTLAMHSIAVLWLLTLRFDRVRTGPARVPDPVWMPLPPPLPDPDKPPPAEPPVATPRVTAPAMAPIPEVVLPPSRRPDWHATAREVAREAGGSPGLRAFGKAPEGPQRPPAEEAAPSIFRKPLPRVGTTVTTPEGETILWVSDYCYVTLGTRSLTLDHIHQGRMGVRTCILYQFGGEKKARDDLFDSLRR